MSIPADRESLYFDEEEVSNYCEIMPFAVAANLSLPHIRR